MLKINIHVIPHFQKKKQLDLQPTFLDTMATVGECYTWKIST